jgi:outer membrane biosynthesis protein TonB
MQYNKALLLTAAFALLLVPASWGQSQSQQPQPADPTAQQPATPAQTTPPTFPQSTKPGEQQPDPPQQPAAQSPSTQDQGSQSSPGMQQSTDSTAASTAGQQRTFMGTVVKTGDGFILRAGDNQYKLDDQDRAKQFEGKDVKVLGKLDRQNNTIQVQSIETGPSM